MYPTKDSMPYYNDSPVYGQQPPAYAQHASIYSIPATAGMPPYYNQTIGAYGFQVEARRRQKNIYKLIIMVLMLDQVLGGIALGWQSAQFWKEYDPDAPDPRLATLLGIVICVVITCLAVLGEIYCLLVLAIILQGLQMALIILGGIALLVYAPSEAFLVIIVSALSWHGYLLRTLTRLTKLVEQDRCTLQGAY